MNGTKDIVATDNVSTINHIFDSLWSEVDFKISDKSIDDP